MKKLIYLSLIAGIVSCNSAEDKNALEIASTDSTIVVQADEKEEAKSLKSDIYVVSKGIDTDYSKMPLVKITNQDSALAAELKSFSALEVVLKSLLTDNQNSTIKIKEFEGEYFGYKNDEGIFILNGPIKVRFKYFLPDEWDEDTNWEYMDLSGFTFEGKKEGDFVSVSDVYEGDKAYNILTFNNDECIFMRSWEYGEGSYYSAVVVYPSKGTFSHFRDVYMKN